MKKITVITAILLSFGLSLSVQAQSITLSISSSAIDSTVPTANVPVSVDNNLSDSIDVWLDVNGVAGLQKKVGPGSGQQVIFSFAVTAGSSYPIQAGAFGFDSGSPVVAYSNSESFTATDAADTTGPVIDNVASSDVGPYSAIIGSSSNKPAEIKVSMGLISGSYTLTFVDTNLSLNPSVKVDGLSSNTTYYFKIELTGGSGYSTSLAEYSFATPAVSINAQIFSIDIDNGIVISNVITNIDLKKSIKYGVSPLSTSSAATPPVDLLSGSHWLTDTVEGLKGIVGLVALILIDPISGQMYGDTISVTSTGIESIGRERNKFSIYPNPITDIASIIGPSSVEATFILYNAIGQKVMQLPIREGKAILRRGSLPKGIYISKIEISGGKPESIRLVIW